MHFLIYMGSPFLLRGALLALKIAALAMALGLLLGLLLALSRLSRHAAIRGAAWFYIWFVRGTPLLLQLVFIFDVLPAVGLTFSTFTTAVVGFSLNEAAFSAEIIRGGILSVSRNQGMAAAALGMPPLLTLRRIILPQAMRSILPGVANQTISMIKGTSIASVIFVNELTFNAEQIVGQNFQFFQVFTAAGLIYLIMTSAIALAQIALERHFDFLREERDGFGHRVRALLGMKPASEKTPIPSGRERLPALIGELCRDIAGADGPCVVCRNVQKTYGGREILKGIDLTVNTGEVVVIMGPSGSGKSTLLRMINHLEPMDWGEITVGGRHVGYEPLAGGGVRPVTKEARAGPCGGAHRDGLSALQFVRAPDSDREHRRSPGLGLSPETRGGARGGGTPAGGGRSGAARGSSAASAVRRAATARGDRSRVGRRTARDVVR